MTNITKTANEYFLTQAQFDARKQAGTLEVGAIYHITDVNFVKAPDTPAVHWSVLCYSESTHKNTWYQMQEGDVGLSIPYRGSGSNNFKVGDLTSTSDGKFVANKNYVDSKTSENAIEVIGYGRY